MAEGDKSISELLREAANRLDAAMPSQPQRQLQPVAAEAVPGPSSHGNGLPTSDGRSPRIPVQAEVARLFAPYSRRPPTTPRSSLRPPAAKATQRISVYTHSFFCLSDHMPDTVPAKNIKMELAVVGLGEKRISFQGRDDPENFRTIIEDSFPQLRDTGGFELLRISGNTRSRNLCIIPCPDHGYTVRYLCNPQTGIGQAMIFIRPLQKSVDMEDTPTSLQQGPPTKCLICDKDIHFNQMKNHILHCPSLPNVAGDSVNTQNTARAEQPSPSNREAQGAPFSHSARAEQPSTSNREAQGAPFSHSARAEQPSTSNREAQGAPFSHSARAEQPSTSNREAQGAPFSHSAWAEQPSPSNREAQHATFSHSARAEQPSPSNIEAQGAPFSHSEWKTEPAGSRAAWLYTSELLSRSETGKDLLMKMDLRDSIEDQERALISFYKAPKTEWASHLKCILEGDAAVGEGVNRFFFSKTISLLQYCFHLNLGNTALTRLFDGEQDHLIPSTCQTLLDSDMFLVAGRMMGHAFLHNGPCVSGISPAIIHVLFGGPPETATIQIEDCPDLDIRSTIQLLEGDTVLTEEEKSSVLQLALSWDLPGVTATNRRWLYEHLLSHAVIARTSRQVKQLRKGLKETKLWPLLTERRDIIPLFLPRASEAAPSSQSILQVIVWPGMEELEEEECSLEDICRVAGYLRSFIENASSAQLKTLLQFWTGWEVLPRELKVEVVNSDLPKSSTCFEALRLPAHYSDYETFVNDIQACLNSTDTGFGLV